MLQKNKSLGDQLSGLAGGASTLRLISKQKQYGTDFSRSLKANSRKRDMTFLKVERWSGFLQCHASCCDAIEFRRTLAQPSRFQLRRAISILRLHRVVDVCNPALALGVIAQATFTDNNKPPKSLKS